VTSDGFASRTRLAAVRDLALLPAIEREACARFVAWGLPEMADVLTPPDDLRDAQAEGRLWVAVDEGDRPIGFALARAIDGVGHLDELDVLEAWGGRGVGTALIASVCSWARARAYAAVTLSTMADIPWNAPMYARRGFRIVGADEIGPGLRAELDRESDRGLPMRGRVLMRLDL
jgi:GNAT superfamily N-acetyltransferase